MKRALAFLAAALVCAAVSWRPALADVCDAGSLAEIDHLDGIASACTMPSGSVLIETSYFQNASRVGGSALAAYPLLRLRGGFADRLELLVDAPSQIAQSGPLVSTVYPTTRLGYGFNDEIQRTANGVTSAGVEVLPPGSRFMTLAAQARYAFDVTTEQRVASRTSLLGFVDVTSSRTLGLEQLFPAVAVGAAVTPTGASRLALSLGTRFVARRTRSQSYGDIDYTQRLRANATLGLGLGTTFNPISQAKAHYLASGFTLRF